MKISAVNFNCRKINFTSIMQENDSNFEKEMNKIFAIYLTKNEEIDQLFENKLINFIEKLEKKEALINWRNNEEALLKKRFTKLVKTIKK